MMLDAVVIGGSQAGLSAAHQLARHRKRFVVLEAGTTVGGRWRSRWDSLRLFTPARYSGLPGLAFPAEPYHLPTKDEVAEYLESYAERFALPLRLGARVEQVRARAGGGFVVRTGDEEFAASNVIVATGAAQRPRVPVIAGGLAADVVQLHSNDYRNPSQLPDGDVLVVGAANSGTQIALELASTGRRVVLAGRDVGRIPRRLLGRDVYDWLWPTLMRFGAESRIGRRMRGRMHGGDPLVGISRQTVQRAGVRRAGRVVDVLDGRPLLENGETIAARSIIWCTGYRQELPWLELPVLDEQGQPRHHGGVTSVPGLYFLGLRFQTRLSSSPIGGVGDDAREIVGHLVRR